MAEKNACFNIFPSIEFVLLMRFLLKSLTHKLCLLQAPARTTYVRYIIPIPISVCSIFMCQNNGMAASVGLSKVYLHSVFGIFNVRTDVDACDCTRGLYGHRKRVRTES